MMQTKIEKHNETFVPKFNFNNQKEEELKIVLFSKPDYVADVACEQKILHLYAPSIAALKKLVIPSYEVDGWKADVMASQRTFGWQEELDENKKLIPKMFQVVFRRAAIQLKK